MDEVPCLRVCLRLRGRDHGVFDVDGFLDGHFFFELGGDEFDGIAFHHRVDIGDDTGHEQFTHNGGGLEAGGFGEVAQGTRQGNREFLLAGKILFLGGEGATAAATAYFLFVRLLGAVIAAIAAVGTATAWATTGAAGVGATRSTGIGATLTSAATRAAFGTVDGLKATLAILGFSLLDAVLHFHVATDVVLDHLTTIFGA